MTALVLQLLALSLRPVLLVALFLAIAWGIYVLSSICRLPGSPSGHADHRPGGRQRMQTKPDWDVEELRLLEQGYTPRWDAEAKRNRRGVARDDVLAAMAAALDRGTR